MKKKAIINIRVALPLDFSDENGKKKYGTPYFEMNSLGVIQNYIKYFSTETDLNQFKQLYKYGQIYVFYNGTEINSVFNCIDWDIIDKEIEHELSYLTKNK
jgi:hypothetical protein